MKSWAEDLLAAVMLMMDSVHLLSSRWWREDHIPQRPPPKDDLIYLNVTPSYYCRCLAWCNRRATTGALVLINTWKGTSTPGPRVDVSRLKKSPHRPPQGRWQPVEPAKREQAMRGKKWDCDSCIHPLLWHHHVFPLVHSPSLCVQPVYSLDR